MNEYHLSTVLFTGYDFVLIFAYHYYQGNKQDRQQEARAVLAASRFIGDFYMPIELQYMYYIPLITLF